MWLLFAGLFRKDGKCGGVNLAVKQIFAGCVVEDDRVGATLAIGLGAAAERPHA